MFLKTLVDNKTPSLDQEDGRESAPASLEKRGIIKDEDERGSSSNSLLSLSKDPESPGGGLAVNNDPAASKTSSRNNADDDNNKGGCFYRFITSRKCCWHCMKKWPRTTALIYGIILPLCILCIVSTVFGVILAKIQAPSEIAINNAHLADSIMAGAVMATVGEIASRIPRVCIELFFEGDLDFEYLPNRLVDGLNITGFVSDINPSFGGGGVFNDDLVNSSGTIVPVNTTVLTDFLTECGKAAEPFIKTLFETAGTSLQGAMSSQISFNWIRCFPGAQGTNSMKIAWLTKADLAEIQPQAQRQFYLKNWKTSQETLYRQFLNETAVAQNNTSMLTESEVFAAYNQSLVQATGGTECELNGAASGWFWFTVLSTVGYGNQVITTQQGRRLVIICGFFSILAFGAMLATAGYVLSVIVDDLLARLKLRIFSRQWVICALWGILYYCFMLFIALTTVRWKRERLGDDIFSLSDGYWFAWISSLTIGLGDIFLEPEVFLGSDMIVFPLMFLFSFVVVSAFLNKFGVMFATCLGKRSLLDELFVELKKTSALGVNA